MSWVAVGVAGVGLVSSLASGAIGGPGKGETPQSTSIADPTTEANAREQYKNSQEALAQQNAFLQATQAQGGLQNQTNVYNQLQGVANGTGPNPAQAQLAQATGANVSNQAAMMAGQRGANANVGMIARQAAQQGAQTQQQSAGQAATMQAQQSLGALQNMGSMANTQAGQQAAATTANTNAALGEQSNVLNSIAAQNNAKVNMQSNINTANAGLTGQARGQQANLMGNLMGSIGSVASMFNEGGQVPQYAEGDLVQSDVMSNQQDPTANMGGMNVNTSMSPPIGTPTPAPASMGSTKSPRSKVGQFFHGAASDESSKPKLTGMSQVGDVTGKALGSIFNKLMKPSDSKETSPASSMEYYGKKSGDSPIQTESEYESDRMNAEKMMPTTQGEQTTMDFDQNQFTMIAHGGLVPALVSPGEQYLPPKAVKKVTKEGKNPLAVGERIPGKPKVKGNNYKNDTVKKNLESGGIVIPNSIMQSKNPHFEAMKFVHATIAKNRGSLPKKGK